MKKIFAFIRERPRLFILLLSALIRLAYVLVDYPLWWDSHIYISIGKYIYSGGQIGIWESFRPLIHPLILGFFWKLGFNPIWVGKLLDVVYALLIIYLTYLLAERLFNRTTAIISSLILSTTPLLVMFTGLILSDPLATVFGLGGIVLVLDKNEKRQNIFLGGFLLALSFLTRFPQGIWFAAVFIVLFSWKDEVKKKVLALSLLILGFILPLIPYLIFNYNRYGSALEPFRTGSWIVTTSTWAYGQGLTYYFTEFFIRLPIYLFFFIYLYYFMKEKYWEKKEHLLLTLIIVLTLAYFLYVPRKETRYLATLLPLFSLLVSFIILKIYHHLKSSPKSMITPWGLAALAVLAVIISLPAGLHFERGPTFQEELFVILEEYNLNGTILSSDPAFVSFLDYPLVTLDGMEFAPSIYEQQRENYQLLFVNDCDFGCAPGDRACTQRKQKLLQQMAAENKEMFKKEVKGCTYSIYLPRTG